MTLEINFNDPNILKGHLDQALPQMGLERVEIRVGKEGGLAYLLFQNGDYLHTLQKKRMRTLNDRGVLRAYFDAVDGYVNAASQHAGNFGFGLVTYEGFRITPEFNRDSPVRQAALGDVSIESAKRLEKFLQMVKLGQEVLQERFGQVQETAKAVRYECR